MGAGREFYCNAGKIHRPGASAVMGFGAHVGALRPLTGRLFSMSRLFLWFVAEIRRQPAFQGGEVHALAARVILNLVLAEIAHGKIG